MDMSKSRFRTKWSHPVNGTYKCHVAQEPVGVMGMVSNRRPRMQTIPVSTLGDVIAYRLGNSALNKELARAHAALQWQLAEEGVVL